MNLLDMIISNVTPLPIGTKYYFRKRILHQGYEVYYKIQDELYHHSYVPYI